VAAGLLDHVDDASLVSQTDEHVHQDPNDDKQDDNNDDDQPHWHVFGVGLGVGCT